MLMLMIILTALNAIALIIGFVWMLTGMGKTSRRTGEQVGADMTAEHMVNMLDQEESVGQTAVFKGKAVKVEREASISFRELWRLVEARAWRKVVPSLLAIGGMLGLLLFGSLALFFGMENKFLGGAMVIIAIYTVVRTLLALVRA